MFRPVAACLLCCGLGVVGCDPDAGADDEGASGPVCVQFDTDACTPQFPGEYERLHQELLLPVCGVQGGACHGTSAAAGAQTGLVIDADLDATYDTLLGGGDAAFVVPGDADCSPLTQRMNTDDDAALMPPGDAPLDEGRRCALAQWVASGAAR